MTLATGRRRRRGRKVGFTLLELCLAGAVIGLIAALSWPSLRIYSRRISLHARAEAVLQRLFTAREQAILSGQAQTVTVAEAGESAAAPAVAEFFPDGSARFFQVDLTAGDEAGVRVTVQDSGRIEAEDEPHKAA